MALPKVLESIWERVQRIGEIRDSLVRIEAKLDAVLATADRHGPRALTASAMPDAGETPDQVAARLDYDTYSAKEIVERVESLTPAERTALLDYEATHKNRTTVIDALRVDAAGTTEGNPQSGSPG